jgi:deoxyribodipyrimidine photo-lyase
MISADRVSTRNTAPVHADRDYVLYWMIAARRTRRSPALEHAVALCRVLNKPLLVVEALRGAYPWAARRHSRFIVDGMADNAASFAAAGVMYRSYVEPADEPGSGRGLLAALSKRAAVVVTDAYPTFFLPRMVEAAAAQLDVRLDVVDGIGLVPMSTTRPNTPTAHSFRRFLHANAARFLAAVPAPRPLDGYDLGRASLVADLTRWPDATPHLGAPDRLCLPGGPGDVPWRGGERAATEQRSRFLEGRLERYEDRSHPDADCASGLSPWLHFGHLSSVDVLLSVLDSGGFVPARLPERSDGSRAGFWGVDAAREAFVDELVTWRELGQSVEWHQPGTLLRYDDLPPWALATLAEHATDPRPAGYTFERLNQARSGDPLWDAAQHQLMRTGVIQNYLRMLWGKRVLGWAPDPRTAFSWLTELNERYAIDGRDANSGAGISWVFGRFDRAWGPERPIFGKIRYMTSENTKKKLHLERWLARFG